MSALLEPLPVLIEVQHRMGLVQLEHRPLVLDSMQIVRHPVGAVDPPDRLANGVAALLDLPL
jgi:hypothetical protein